jgi:hypothetical protein
MGFRLEPAGQGWKEGVTRLHVTMISPEVNESEAMLLLIRRLKSIPEEKMAQYLCKHTYVHTEDCIFCGYKVEHANR